jgi:hypothetical protein
MSRSSFPFCLIYFLSVTILLLILRLRIKLYKATSGYTFVLLIPFFQFTAAHTQPPFTVYIVTDSTPGPLS